VSHTPEALRASQILDYPDTIGNPVCDAITGMYL
jgi:hypothetical protein